MKRQIQQGFLAMSMLLVSQTIFSQPALFNQKELISVKLNGLTIDKVQNFIYRFEKGQPGAVHFHVAPVIGYIVKGEITYQIENNSPVILKAGDAFYEPVGKEITRFDNTAPDEETVFIDLSLLKKDQPPIKFEKQPTQTYDIRLLQERILNLSVEKVVVSTAELGANEVRPIHSHKGPVIGFVIRGEIKYKVGNNTSKVIKAGESFYEPEGEQIELGNNSDKEKASYVNIFLLKKGQRIPNITK